jgi:hypothetical protein
VIDRVSLASNIERRASISCTEDLRNRPISANSWSTVTSSQRSATFDIPLQVPANTTEGVRSHLLTAFKAVSEALNLLQVPTPQLNDADGKVCYVIFMIYVFLIFMYRNVLRQYRKKIN